MSSTGHILTLEEAAAELQARIELRRRCREDLLEFIKYTHPSWEEAPHHRVLCDWLMKLQRREILRLAIFAPPRHGKSEIVSRRFPAWCMGLDSSWQMICAQATADLAKDMGANVRDIIASPEYKEIFPSIRLKKDAKAAGRWMVHDVDDESKQPGIYYSAGVSGTIIGRGAQLLNIDDPLDSKGAMSPRMRDQAAEFYFGDAIQRLMYPKLILFTTTRRHEDDLAGRIMPPESEWEETDTPCVYKAQAGQRDSKKKQAWYIIKLEAIIDEGTENERALWPGDKGERYPLEDLKEIRQSIFDGGDNREWFAQYQQQITPEEGIFCKKRWFSECRYKDRPDTLYLYATSDLAVTEKTLKKNPDYTEHAIYGLEGLEIKYDSQGKMQAYADKLYVLDWWCGCVTPDVWISKLADMLEEWKPNYWFGTKGKIANATKGYIERELRQRRIMTQVEWISDNLDKVSKGVPLRGMARQRRIRFPADDHKYERVIQQICSFPNAAKDDAFDTAANMVRSLEEVPEAFMAAPTKFDQEPLDAYELCEAGLGPQANQWKVL